MPNHCSNSLTVVGPDAAAFMAAVADGEDDNFIRTLIPEPEELSGIHSGSCTIDGERVSEWREGPDGKPVALPAIERQHIIDLHGTADMLAWCHAHWGVKWGAYDCGIDWDAKRIQFDSAWAPPQTAIDTISAMFPNATFTLAYAEGGSCFYGRVVFQNGTVLDSDESSDFWDPDADPNGDALDSLTPGCAEHLAEYGLHCGG